MQQQWRKSVGIEREEFLGLLESAAAAGQKSEDIGVQGTAQWLQGLAVFLRTTNPKTTQHFLAMLKLQQSFFVK